MPADFRRELPWLLWVSSMGMILFWIHDDSAGRLRTRRLIERTSDLVVRIISLLSNPLMAPVRRTTLRLLEDLKASVEGES